MYASNTNPAAKKARCFHGLALAVPLMLQFHRMLSRNEITETHSTPISRRSPRQFVFSACSAISALIVLSTFSMSAQTPIPRTADGHPNLQGVWQAKSSANDNVERVVEGGTI